MQLRMSPGGSTSKSRRRRPELPPSSVTVTTAEMSRPGSHATYFFNPCSKAESPVPPPIDTTRRGVENVCSLGKFQILTRKGNPLHYLWVANCYHSHICPDVDSCWTGNG